MKAKGRIAEFNTEVLDTIMGSYRLGYQEPREFTIVELMQRGMTRGAAREFCERGITSGQLERRMGRARLSGRVSWLYRKKEK